MYYTENLDLRFVPPMIFVVARCGSLCACCLIEAGFLATIVRADRSWTCSEYKVSVRSLEGDRWSLPRDCGLHPNELSLCSKFIEAGLMVHRKMSWWESCYGINHVSNRIVRDIFFPWICFPYSTVTSSTRFYQAVEVLPIYLKVNKQLEPFHRNCRMSNSFFWKCWAWEGENQFS